MSAHARFAPSSMARTVACPGWQKIAAEVPPEEETEDAREGTAAHFIGETMLRSMAKEGHFMTSADFVGQQAPNGVLLTDEMYEAATMYYRAVMDIAGRGRMNALAIEEGVNCSYLHRDCWGTPDAYLWDEENLTLHVWDFKYGFRRVSPIGNYQLVSYAVGLLDEITKGRALAPSPVVVKLHVSQPRCYDGKGSRLSWECAAQDLRPLANLIQQACLEADSPNPRVRVTEHGCRDCPGRGGCPASREMSADLGQYAQEAQVSVLSDAALGYELSVLDRALRLLKSRYTALEADAEARSRAGKTVNGWAIREVQGREEWARSVEEVLTVGRAMGVDLGKPTEAITPNQARDKINRAGIDPAVMNGYYRRKPSSLKLKPADTTEARLIFQQESTSNVG